MSPLCRASLTIPAWLLGASIAAAQTPTALGESPAWSSFADAAPRLWGIFLVAIILTLALLVQLSFVLRSRRIDPPALTEALERSIQAGNYQEAWEACHRWRQTLLGRMLQPALERIGQGRDAAETRIADEARREARHFQILFWCLWGGLLLVGTLCLVGIDSLRQAVAQGAMSPDAPRLAALATGDAALLAGLAIAVVVPAFSIGWWLRARSRLSLQAASERGRGLIAALPYEEIEGLRIGRDFHAGTILGEPVGLGQTGRLQVSKELTTQCPSCNGPINSSRTSCPHCGQQLAWS